MTERTLFHMAEDIAGADVVPGPLRRGKAPLPVAVQGKDLPARGDKRAGQFPQPLQGSLQTVEHPGEEPRAELDGQRRIHPGGRFIGGQPPGVLVHLDHRAALLQTHHLAGEPGLTHPDHVVELQPLDIDGDRRSRYPENMSRHRFQSHVVPDDSAYKPLRIILTLFPDLFRSGEDDEEAEPSPFHLPEALFADPRQEPLVNDHHPAVRVGHGLLDGGLGFVRRRDELGHAAQAEAVPGVTGCDKDDCFHPISSARTVSRSRSSHWRMRLRLCASTKHLQR